MTGRRGRPPKPKPTHELFMPMADGSLDAMAALSDKIAALLQTPRNALTDKLAEAAAYYPTTLEIKTHAPLRVRRQGNRPKIHLATLLRDCAVALHEHKGMEASRELSRIGERTEGQSEVIKCAKAVLTALGINHPQSLRQQATQAAVMLQVTRKITGGN